MTSFNYRATRGSGDEWEVWLCSTETGDRKELIDSGMPENEAVLLAELKNDETFLITLLSPEAQKEVAQKREEQEAQKREAPRRVRSL